jgi:hypothetical protein
VQAEAIAQLLERQRPGGELGEQAELHRAEHRLRAPEPQAELEQRAGAERLVRNGAGRVGLRVVHCA